MTEPELNKAIAEALGVFTPVPYGLVSELVGNTLHYYDGSRVLHGCHPDYCDDWNTLMPLVVQHKLSFWQDEAMGDWYVNQTMRDMGGDYLCDTFEEDIENENPQRALAECLLKVLQGEQTNELKR